MDRFSYFLLSVLLTAFVFTSSLADGTESVSSELSELSYDVDTKTVTEGYNLTVVCNATGTRIYWTKNYEPFRFERMLNITNVTRNFTGLYTCYASNISDTESVDEHNIGEEIYTFFLDVTYPAKIISVNVSKTTLRIDDDFEMQVKLEGNPTPTTTFKSLTDGTTWYHETTKDGNYTIRIPKVKCVETGNYELTCENSLGNDSKRENIYVLCRPEPDPRFPLNNTVKPRLGDNINITVHVVGYPRASFQWWHGGTQLFNHTDVENTTMLTLHDIQFVYFGQYELVMKNTAGNNSVLFDVQADGPPDSAYDLKVSDVTSDTANISFITGYDYNATQSFYIMRDVDGKLTDFHRKVNDTPNDHGGKEVSVVIGDLQESTSYNLVVRSGNSRGNSTDVSNNINIFTYGKPEPDPKVPVNTTFEPRLGDSLILTAHARGSPMPTFRWKHNDKSVESTDDNYTSTVVIKAVVVDDFGKYTLNMTNRFGYYSEDYEILADGPPEPVSNLYVSNVNETCAELRFTTGYNYNSSQTFIVERYEDGKVKEIAKCEDLTSGTGGEQFSCVVCSLEEDALYNVTILSQNSHGESQHVPASVKFSTYGKPKPDPGHTTNNTFKPRLGNTVSLSIQSIGYPPPRYEWFHNGEQIHSHDTNYTSTVHIESITINDFGKYTLNMSNELGSFAEVYEILAEGPPDSVTKLSLSDPTADSVELEWKAGFDYDSKQSFEIRGTVNDKDLTDMKDIEDTSGGKGGIETTKLENLDSSSNYNIFLVAKNARGSASHSNTISFTTKASKKGTGTTTAEYVGYVMGGVGAIVFIIVIITVTRWCLKRKNEVPYEELPEREEQEIQPQPHHYRYDDAAAPSGV